MSGNHFICAALALFVCFGLTSSITVTRTCSAGPCNLHCNSTVTRCDQDCTALPCSLTCDSDSCNERCVTGNCTRVTCNSKDSCVLSCGAGGCKTFNCHSKLCQLSPGVGTTAVCSGRDCVGSIFHTGLTFKCLAENECNIVCREGHCTVEAPKAKTTTVTCMKGYCKVTCKKESTCTCTHPTCKFGGASSLRMSLTTVPIFVVLFLLW